MTSALGPMERWLGHLLETWQHRYAFEHNRDKGVIVFTRGGMQVVAREVEGGQVRVLYESAPHEPVVEVCTVEQAALLIDALLARKGLGRVPKPDGPSGSVQ